MLVGSLVSAMGSGATVPYLFVFLSQGRHLSGSLVGGLLTARAVGALIGAAFCGAWIDRIGVRTGTLGGLIACASSTIALLWVRGPLTGTVLLDRAFDANGFLTDIDAAGAKLLARAKATRNLRVLRLLPDGSFLSVLDGLTVRIIEAWITMTRADGPVLADDYRLITTLLDHRRDSADVLLRLYHERWEIDSAFLALRHTILRGHILRSGDPAGVQ